eukprot:4113026-Karenia_brevis.AAC.1
MVTNDIRSSHIDIMYSLDHLYQLVTALETTIGIITSYSPQNQAERFHDLKDLVDESTYQRLSALKSQKANTSDMAAAGVHSVASPANDDNPEC